MNYTKLFAISVLTLGISNPSFAGVYPSFNPNLTGFSTSLGPNTLDYTFDQSGLNGTFAKSGTGWTLNVTGSGASAFYTPGVNSVYSVNNSAYSLVANFNASGAFTTGTLTIGGTVSGTPAGSVAQTAGQPLLAATLTAFGYNASQATIGFETHFTSSWADQAAFTGGSTGDLVYLFNQGGVSTGSGVLSNLISEFKSGTFAPTTFVNVESLAAVPLPLPAVLFGTGLTALMGFARQRRNHPKSI